jgi:hypothetical protein
MGTISECATELLGSIGAVAIGTTGNEYDETLSAELLRILVF